MWILSACVNFEFFVEICVKIWNFCSKNLEIQDFILPPQNCQWLDRLNAESLIEILHVNVDMSLSDTHISFV